MDLSREWDISNPFGPPLSPPTITSAQPVVTPLPAGTGLFLDVPDSPSSPIHCYSPTVLDGVLPKLIPPTRPRLAVVAAPAGPVVPTQDPTYKIPSRPCSCPPGPRGEPTICVSPGPEYDGPPVAELSPLMEEPDWPMAPSWRDFAFERVVLNPRSDSHLFLRACEDNDS